MARDLTHDYTGQPSCEAPAHVLFPQLVRIAERYLRDQVQPIPPADIRGKPYDYVPDSIIRLRGIPLGSLDGGHIILV